MLCLPTNDIEIDAIMMSVISL